MCGLAGFIIMLLGLVSEAVGVLNYCDLETIFCNKGKHVACLAENYSDIEPGARLDYKTRLNFLEAINKHRNYMKIKWDPELETLSDLIDTSAKNVCLTSFKFVDITSIQLKYCVGGDDFYDSAVTNNVLVESIGCTAETEMKSTACYLLDCLYNFSNRSTILEYEGIIESRSRARSLSLDTYNVTEGTWNWNYLHKYYQRLKIDSKLEYYDLWAFCGLIITVWLANFFIILFICCLRSHLKNA